MDREQILPLLPLTTHRSNKPPKANKGKHAPSPSKSVQSLLLYTLQGKSFFMSSSNTVYYLKYSRSSGYSQHSEGNFYGKHLANLHPPFATPIIPNHICNCRHCSFLYSNISLQAHLPILPNFFKLWKNTLGLDYSIFNFFIAPIAFTNNTTKISEAYPDQSFRYLRSSFHLHLFIALVN